MPDVRIVHLTDTERDALAEVRERFGTYKDVGAEVDRKERTVKYWFQQTNRRPFPYRELETFLLAVLRARPGEYDALRFVLKGEARSALSYADQQAERERQRDYWREKAGLPEDRAAVGPKAAREAGHVGFVKVAALD